MIGQITRFSEAPASYDPAWVSRLVLDLEAAFERVRRAVDIDAISAFAAALHASTHQVGGTDPLTAIAASILTGTLTKAQQHALTAYLDAANVFSVAGNSFSEVLGVAKGIKFPATQVASTDVNTLDDYEEGTWTVGDGSGAGLAFTGVICRYVKVGRIVYATGQFAYPVTASGLAAILNGFPFTCGDVGASGSDRYPPGAGFATVYRYMRENQAFMQLYLASGAAYTNAQMSATNHNFDVVYRSAN